MTTIATLVPSKAPNLPLAPQMYDQQTFDRFSNILRLYFNQIDNFSASLISDVGIGLLRSPYGAFEDTVSHTVTANTANVMTFNTTDYSSGVTLVGGSKITATYPGIYNLQFSTQFQSTDNAPQDVSIWLRVNGVDVVGSTGIIGLPAIKSVGDPYHDIKGWNFFLSLSAGQYVEIYWTTTSANVTIQAYAVGTSPTRPSTASNVATLTFVSALPA
jgi:hypothetical protein